MTGLTPEVLDALVRLMNRELDYGEIDDDEQLFAIARTAKDGRLTLHEVILELRKRRYTFVQIGDKLGVDVSTAARWATPPSPPGRRPRPSVEGGDDDDD